MYQRIKNAFLQGPLSLAAELEEWTGFLPPDPYELIADLCGLVIEHFDKSKERELVLIEIFVQDLEKQIVQNRLYIR